MGIESNNGKVLLVFVWIFLVVYFILWESQYTKLMHSVQFSSVQFSSFAQSCPTLCDPMNHSTPGLPVHHQLPEFTQTHVDRVSDAIQPSHPLSSPSPAPSPSQHQSLFQWVLHKVHGSAGNSEMKGINRDIDLDRPGNCWWLSSCWLQLITSKTPAWILTGLFWSEMPGSLL